MVDKVLLINCQYYSQYADTLRNITRIATKV